MTCAGLAQMSSVEAMAAQTGWPTDWARPPTPTSDIATTQAGRPSASRTPFMYQRASPEGCAAEVSSTRRRRRSLPALVLAGQDPHQGGSLDLVAHLQPAPVQAERHGGHQNPGDQLLEALALAPALPPLLEPR